MYKQQSPLSVSSTVWALLVTVVVLLIAASANAQTTDTISIEPVQANNVSQTNSATPPLLAPMPDTPTSSNPGTPTDVRSVPATSQPTNTTRAVTRVNASNTPITTTFTNESSPNRMQSWREAIKNRQVALEQKRMAMQNASSSRAALLRTSAQANVTVGINSIATSLNNAITNSLNINTRLKNKAIELEARGVDMATTNALLGESEQYLNLAMEALQGVSLNAQYAVTSSDPVTDWMAVRQQLSEVRDLIKQAHTVMREASASIKIAIKPMDTN